MAIEPAYNEFLIRRLLRHHPATSLPAYPTEDGNYSLVLTVTGGTLSLGWVAVVPSDALLIGGELFQIGGETITIGA